MKMILKWTACAACAVWTGASASAATETVTGQNVIGLTTIKDDSRAYLPLAAAYTGTGATELTVANIVQTATLAEGDELYAYDPEKKQYDVYTLGTDGKWTIVKTVQVSASGIGEGDDEPGGGGSGDHARTRFLDCAQGRGERREAGAPRRGRPGDGGDGEDSGGGGRQALRHTDRRAVRLDAQRQRYRLDRQGREGRQNPRPE